MYEQVEILTVFDTPREARVYETNGGVCFGMLLNV